MAWLRAHYGWSVAFMSAAVAMLVLAADLHRLQALPGRRRREGRRRRSRGEPPLAPGEVRSRVITLLAIFGISLVFWIAFYQIFYTFTFWARDNTATTLAPGDVPGRSNRSA